MLTPALIIQKKRDGKELSHDEIKGFIRGASAGDIADYQATAFCMAVFFRGMSLDETVALTEAMLESGERYDFSGIPGMKIDKHSTGGVGDKVSLILAPLAAACGLKIPMMSGRGLGFSGGTLDKLESISGFQVNLTRTQIEAQLSRIGCAMIGQSETIAPADKKLYALRDVTGTVECIPLIVASILSKKLAEGAEALVMDIKVGSGAFMKTREQARKLGNTISKVARKMNLPCRAILTSMDQPLGYSVGNALEVREAIEVLRNERQHERGGLVSTDLRELTVHLCAHMLEVGKKVRSLEEGRKLAQNKLADGSAWETFLKIVDAQGGSTQQVLHPGKLPQSYRTVVWKAKKRGFVSKIQTDTIGRIVIELGGGRKKASDPIDPSVGLVFHRKLGAKVQSGEGIATAHISEHSALNHAALHELEELFQGAVEISGTRKPVPKLVMGRQ